MTGNEGISPDGTREILCGLSYRQVVSVAGDGVTMKDAARLLGVAEDHFRRKMHRLGLVHWFPRTQHGRTRRVTAKGMQRLVDDGYALQTAAKLTGLSYSRFQHLAKEYGLQDSFYTD